MSLGITRLAGVGLAGMMLAACGDSVVDPSDLEGGEWRLESMQRVAGPVIVPEDPARFTIDFEADGRLNVIADCNSCGGEYSLDDSSLTVSPLACTRVGCPGPPLGVEFTQLLEGRASVDLDGSRLTIRSPGGTLIFRR